MDFTITDKEKKVLLSDAREVITAKLEKRQPQYENELSLAGGTSALAQPCGAFVTLREKKTDKLRGCIGRMMASTPLQQTVRTMALAAAFEDPRFPPLSVDEINSVCIEISALSPMEICPDPLSVKVGVHGLYLMHRGRSGVLLPQVPVEQGWDREEYLSYICVKAGLPPGSYGEEGAELFTFTATVFEEE